MTKPMNDELLLALAERAKNCMYAMRACFRRDPDVGDFFSEFREVVERQKYLASIKSNENKPANKSQVP